MKRVRTACALAALAGDGEVLGSEAMAEAGDALTREGPASARGEVRAILDLLESPTSRPELLLPRLDALLALD